MVFKITIKVKRKPPQKFLTFDNKKIIFFFFLDRHIDLLFFFFIFFNFSNWGLCGGKNKKIKSLDDLKNSQQKHPSHFYANFCLQYARRVEKKNKLPLFKNVNKEIYLHCYFPGTFFKGWDRRSKILLD